MKSSMNFAHDRAGGRYITAIRIESGADDNDTIMFSNDSYCLEARRFGLYSVRHNRATPPPRRAIRSSRRSWYPSGQNSAATYWSPWIQVSVMASISGFSF